MHNIETDYSLCTNYLRDKAIESTQNSSILTSICLDNDNDNNLLTRTNSVGNTSINSRPLPHDSGLMESEFFFQEVETTDAPAEFNFTKISEFAKGNTAEQVEAGYRLKKNSNQTIDELVDINEEENDRIVTKDANGGADVETVKNKLANLWNNVKYGWANYLKKPNKISLENGPIYILGKRFNSEMAPYERSTSDSTNNSSTIPYDIVDANKLGSLNESYIYPSIPIPKSNQSEYDEYLSKQAFSLNSNDFSPLSASPSSPMYLTSPNNGNKLKADYLVVENEMTESMNKNPRVSNNDSSNLSRNKPDYMQLYYLNMQKTSLEKEIQSRLWFTYRKDFTPLNGNSKYTNDCGWGCMLRSAQMLIGQALLQNNFGRDWSLYNKSTTRDYQTYKKIISLFNDRPSRDCPFGIHRLLEVADHKLIGNPNLENSTSTNSAYNSNHNKFKQFTKESASRVGSWFGPTSVCMLMKEALEQATSSLLSNLKIYVAQDSTIYKQDILDLCLYHKDFRPCIILVSVRLGGEELNDIYIPSLKIFLEMDLCVGIIGGKPKHSLYFMGYQGDKVIYLDPHFCQPTVNIYTSNDNLVISTSSHSSLSSSKQSYEDTTIDSELFDNSTFHCENPSKTPFTKLDPSLAIGFLCSSLDDLERLCALTKIMSSTSEKIFPIFGVSDESYEESQLRYQMLCDDDILTETILSNTKIPAVASQKSKTESIPINKQINNSSKSRASSQSVSSSKSKSFNDFFSSIPTKVRHDDSHNKGKATSPKKSAGSFLVEKFTRQKNCSKKKSESEDFVLI